MAALDSKAGELVQPTAKASLLKKWDLLQKVDHSIDMNHWLWCVYLNLCQASGHQKCHVFRSAYHPWFQKAYDPGAPHQHPTSCTGNQSCPTWRQCRQPNISMFSLMMIRLQGIKEPGNCSMQRSGLLCCLDLWAALSRQSSAFFLWQFLHLCWFDASCQKLENFQILASRILSITSRLTFWNFWSKFFVNSKMQR